MSRDSALLEAFAAELKARRAVLKWSQEELAFRAEVNRTYIAKLELAKNQPTLSVLHSIATALNSNMPDLLANILHRYNRNAPQAELPSLNSLSEPKNASANLPLARETAIQGTTGKKFDSINSRSASGGKRQVVLEFDFMGCVSQVHDRLTEIAVVELINGRITGRTFHVYLNPGDEVNSYAFSRFKLAREFLNRQPSFSEVAGDLIGFIEGAEILTHNPFYPYLKMISDELESINLPTLDTVSPNIISTFTLARKLLKIKSPSIEKLCSRFEVDPSKIMQQPTLMWDARLLAEVYVRMCPAA